jgi:hypothetical protein
MIDPNDEARLRKISASGLKVLDMAPPTDIPTVLEAWMRVVNMEAKPVASISQQSAGALDDVDHQWLLQASGNSLFDADDSFLISIAGPGSLKFGWTRVQWSSAAKLASQLQDEGGPEFLGMSLDGHCICATTTEEYDYWIVVHHFG